MTFLGSAPERSANEIERMANVFAALGHPVRLRIVEGLLTGECSVKNMVDCLELPQPLVSRHLAVLRQAGVVRAERLGRVRNYRVVHPVAGALVQWFWGEQDARQRGPAGSNEE